MEIRGRGWSITSSWSSLVMLYWSMYVGKAVLGNTDTEHWTFTTKQLSEAAAFTLIISNCTIIVCVSLNH